MPADRRPPRYPPPKFPMTRPKLFASTPPAIFPPLLGLIGLGLALRQSLVALDLPPDPVEVLLGALLGLWAFAVLAIAVKAIRRRAVVVEDLRPLPGRAGLAAASMSGMAAAGMIAPHAPRLAVVLAFASLFAHAILALLLIPVMRAQGEDGLSPNPSWHLSFVGFIVAAPVLARLGWAQTATVLFWVTLPVALAIWLLSLIQLIRRIPPAPLRPMLAIHLAPAALLSSTATLIGQHALAEALILLSIAILAALLASLRWLLASGFSPIWGAMTFPLAAFAAALLTYGGPATMPGLIVALAGLGIIPVIAWSILKLWPAGKLAAKTNAATA